MPGPVGVDKCPPIVDDPDVPYAVVVTGKETAPGLEKKLFDTWRPFLDKIHEVHVLRSRKGGSSKPEGDRLLRCIRGKFDATADGDPELYLRRLVDAAIELAEDDAGEKKCRYAFAIAGLTIASYAKPSWLTDPIEETIDPGAAEPASRESELNATIKSLREWGNDCARNHGAAMQAATQLAEGLVRIAEATAQTRGAADAAYWTAQTTLNQQANALSVELAQINAATRRADRGYDTLLAVGKMFAGDLSGLLEDITARPGSDSSASSASATSSATSSGPSSSTSSSGSTTSTSSGPDASSSTTGGKMYGGASEDELRRILGAKGDVLDRFIRRRSLSGAELERETAELRRIWTTIPKGEALAIVRVAVSVLGARRAIVFSQWVKKDLGL